MSDGCWVQFWDDKMCLGATLRFDENTGTGARLVPNLDDYLQSDGSKEGDEPDSLVTGTRTWLLVYKNKDFEGSYASFGPNTRVDVLDDYGFGGNISSFKMYDYKPAGFIETGPGSPVAYVASDQTVDAETVNSVFRSVVAGAVAAIPGVGAGLGALIKGIWPDVNNNKEQLWGSFQNYLNQAIAGVYWQLTYDNLNAELQGLYLLAIDFADAEDSERAAKSEYFTNLLSQITSDVPTFISETAPESRFLFMVPFATLHLAVLREQIENYEYYYGAPPSEEYRKTLVDKLDATVDRYWRLLAQARETILARRDQMIYVDDDALIDLYSGSRSTIMQPANDARRLVAERVRNELALKLDQHIAVSQLWVHYKPGFSGPVLPPTLAYTSGPEGYYWYGNTDFEQMAGGGAITAATLWTIDGTNNPAYQNGLELSVDGVGKGRVGGSGGTPATLELGAGEAIVDISGSSDLYFLSFGSSTDSVSAGDPIRKSVFSLRPRPELVNARLTGVSGSAGGYAGNPSAEPCVRAISAHRVGELPIDTPAAAPGVEAAAPEPAEA